MPSRERELKVVILGDATSAQRALGKLDRSVTATGSNVEKQQSKLAKFGPAIATGAALGAGALIKLGGDAIDAASESRKATAQTEAVIKSTGGIANVSRGHVEKLAGELKKISLLDDEAIQAGENVLLTFTNIRNQGPGKQIFDDATRAALDLSVAMKTDIPNAALIVGKALNDPEAGLGALRRVGVQFSPQKEQLIRDLVAVGDTAGAQKVIIEELNVQFGGSAQKAGDAANAVDRLRVKFDDLEEAVGGQLIGLLEEGEDALNDIANFKATGALKTVLDGWTTALDGVAAAAGRAYDALKRLLGLVSGLDAGEAARDAGNAGIPLGDLVQSVRSIFRNPFRRHEGGPIHSHPHVRRPGLAADEVPAILQRGEYVIRKEAVAAIGRPALDRLNRSRGDTRPAGGRLTEDSVPYTSPTGARLLDFRWNRALYADGSAYTSAGWVKARPTGGLRFRPDVRLDTSQVEDRRGQTAGTWHAGGPVGAMPAESPAGGVALADAPAGFDYDRLARAIAGAMPATHSKQNHYHLGPIQGLTLDEVLAEGDRKARIAALGGED